MDSTSNNDEVHKVKWSYFIMVDTFCSTVDSIFRRRNSLAAEVTERMARGRNPIYHAQYISITTERYTYDTIK